MAKKKEDKIKKGFKAKLAKQPAPVAFKAIVEPSVPENVQQSSNDSGKYRYLCEACSNNAFIADYKGGGLVKKCKSCGKVFYTKLENYLLIQ